MTHPTVVGPFVGDGVELPAMYEVRQRFNLLPEVDALAELDASWAGGAGRLAELEPGASVAVAVGSRGIADIAPVVREVVGGQCVALDGVLSGTPCATQVTAVMASTFVRIPVLDLHSLMRGTGPVSVKLLALLQQELGRDLRAATLAMIDSIG